MAYLQGKLKKRKMILRSWRELKILMKRRYPFLQEEDFHFEDGNRETMLKQLREKLNKTKEEMDLFLAELQLS
jgi:hypothetical protein